MKAVIIFGLSASGKSTKAKEYVDRGFVHIERDIIRFSCIDPGGDWTTYKFTSKKEKEVTRIWWEQLHSAGFEGKDVVISDTLLNRKHRDDLVDALVEMGYKDISVWLMEESLETLIQRDKGRGKKSVGEEVIRSQWERFYEEDKQ